MREGRVYALDIWPTVLADSLRYTSLAFTLCVCVNCSCTATDIALGGSVPFHVAQPL